MSQINGSRLVSKEPNKDTLNKWKERVKQVTDSRLKELVRGEGTREVRENVLAQCIVEEEQFWNDQMCKPGIDSTTMMACRMALQEIGEPLTYQSREERQAELRQDYEDQLTFQMGEYWCRKNRVSYVRKRQCVSCQEWYFTPTMKQRFCSYPCQIDAFIKRRKTKVDQLRSSKVCQFCHQQFKAKRTDAKYCCQDHRVRAFLKRTKEGPI